jgi:hypothetical protein
MVAVSPATLASSLGFRRCGLGDPIGVSKSEALLAKDPIALSQVLYIPHWPKVCEVKGNCLLLWIGEIKRRQRNQVVYVYLSNSRPAHAISELGFDPLSKLFRGAPH